ncbi:MAG: ABC-2 type transporter [Parcubacteria group bacterium GW2011_GWA2_42_28]|nr:MAG: ABC-2 type transporter [Parcubacteria group bacterium GW2011_GWA2_42_28]KKT53966.1 MAG: ABC-2 type transporter [Parcubacteria group bacterium GW2011_GWC2_44_22]
MLSFLAGFRPVSWGMVPIAIIFMLLIALLFTALGTALASIIQDMQGFQLIMNFLVMPLFFLSGALFPFEGLPTALLIVAKVDPLSYGVDGLRGALINSTHFGLTTDFLVLSGLVIGLLAIGGYLFSKIEA